MHWDKMNKGKWSIILGSHNNKLHSFIRIILLCYSDTGASEKENFVNMGCNYIVWIF